MRAETEQAYCEGDYLDRLMIAFYVLNGWDKMWPYTRMPEWLAPEYDPNRFRLIDGFAQQYEAKLN